MPKRIVDGEALWSSDKLAQVPAEYRAEYANLIPLAEANGSFEASTKKVWSRVYAINRPDVSEDDVAKILAAFEAAEMLKLWEKDGKLWGFWVGIDKPGRLPSEVHQARYVDLPPVPPKRLSRKFPESAGNNPRGFGFGLGMDRLGQEGEEIPESDKSESRIYKKPLNLEKVFVRIAREILGYCDDPKWSHAELKSLAARYDTHKLAEEFEKFCRSGNCIKNPIKEFLRGVDGRMRESIESESLDPNLDVVCADLYEMGNQVFAAKHRLSINELLAKYGKDEVLAAYKEFIYGKEDKAMSWAPRDFCEGGATAVILARRKRNERLDKQQDYIDHELERLRQEGERESAEFAQKEAEEARLAEEELAFFTTENIPAEETGAGAATTPSDG